MPYFYYDPTYLLLLPAILLALYAQGRVRTTYAKFAKIGNRRGLTGADVARRILDRNGLTHVRVERISGNLTDHYDPRANVVRLSGDVHDNASIAAVGIAAHEVGHACQHHSAYLPLSIRSAMAPVVSFGSNAVFPILLIGLFVGSQTMLNIAIILYAFVNKPQLGVILFSLAFVLYGLPEYLKAYDNHIHKGEKAVTVGCLALAILFTVAGLLFFFLLGLNPNIK